MTPVSLSLQVNEENAKIVAKFLLELFPDKPTENIPEVPKQEVKPKTEKPVGAKPKPEAKSPVEEKSAESAESASSEKKVSLSDVRAKALVLSKAGRQETLKELFGKHGGSKLSEIDESKYEALLADMEAAING